MDNLTPCISLIFGLIAFLTVFTFFQAAGSGTRFGILLLTWIALQICISASGFYHITGTAFPTLLIMVVPPVILMAWLFLARSGKSLLDRMDLHLLTVIHVVRAPTEVVMYWLFICRVVPAEITLQGGNLDMVAGLTAPAIYYFGVLKEKIRWQLMVCWNLLGLGLAISVALKFVFSAAFIPENPTFEQPNIALFQFPFVFLPAVVIPLVICSHLAAIRLLVKSNSVQSKNKIDPGYLLRQLMIKTLASHGKHQN
ncbi:hypothetical protein [Dyadobacter sp. Leaf189]|uniref:hypothetical protein n=1 Tax=Dyadobacter sp. Leaf189 TaxID=1736295 RepID=UPI0006FEB363|nr:hypothetical protein [Dyadobacter sp. Leaf189]KQS33204.1 hypothetical protein ASG33_03715 [Dyadobacter sp. Leaf189]